MEVLGTKGQQGKPQEVLLGESWRDEAKGWTGCRDLHRDLLKKKQIEKGGKRNN